MSISLNLCTSGLFSLGVSEMLSFGWNESMPFISRSPADRHLSKDKLTMSHTTHRDGVRKCQGFEQKRTSALSKEIFPSLKAVPQPMPDCTLWNNVAVKLTNVIGFSFHESTAFVISTLIFPASSNLEGFTFLKMCVYVQKGPHLSTGFQLKLLLLQGKNVGVPLALFSFHSFTHSLPREEEYHIHEYFRASYLTSGRHGHYFGHSIIFCPPLWSRHMVLTSERGGTTQFKATLQARLLSIQQRRK